MAGRLHFWTFLAVLAFAPLPLGSNRPWSWSLLALLVGLLVATWPFVAAGDRMTPLRRLIVPTMLAALAVLWAVLQVLPVLPASLAHVIWNDADIALPPHLAPTPRVAVAPDRAVTEIMRLLSYMGVFWLAVQYARSPRRSGKLLDTVALAAGVYSVVGLIAHFSGSESILGLPKTAYQDELTGPFVNPNHFATYAGLGLIASLVAFRRRLSRLNAAGVVRELLDGNGLFLATALACLIALPATGSRAGNVAAAIGLLVLVGVGASLDLRPRRRMLALISVTALVLAGAGAAFWLLLQGDIATAGADDRLRVYRLALVLIEGRPYLGYGMGAFAPLFASARPINVTQIWTEAHNGYLELAIELGLPAAAALLAALVWLVGLCGFGVIRRRKDRMFPLIGLSATAVIAAHATLDFSARVPAVSVTWMALLGLAVAQSWSSQEVPRVRPNELTAT